MAIEATFTVGPEAFPLGTIFQQLSGVTVEIERIVPGPDVVIPYFWVRGVPSDDIVAEFREHEGVRDLRLIDFIEDEYLLRVEWMPEYVGILMTMADSELTVNRAVGTNERWTFEVRGDSPGDISTFQSLCQERDIPVTLTALHALTPIEPGIGSSLTDDQKEALLLAYERGYFNSPRDVTMEELGAELGISHQAVASRLRRGLNRVLASTVPALKSE